MRRSEQEIRELFRASISKFGPEMGERQFCTATKIKPSEIKYHFGDEKTILDSPSKYVDIFVSELGHGNTGVKIDELFFSELGELELKFVTLNKSSPLVITCKCVVSALTLAVIISGGKVEADLKGNLKFTLAPLGKGIKSLLDAFGKVPPKNK